MNKLNLISIACGMGLCLASCSSDSEPEEPQVLSKALSIATSIQTKSVVTTAFANGDKMNLFVKSGSSASSEDYVASAVSASYNGSGWSLSPNVELKEGGDVYVSAFYPYQSGNTQAASVPVSIEAQTDYLYSGSAVRASYSSPQATLSMKHALSILAFNISLSGVEEGVTLNSIQIQGEGFYTQGTLDVTTGKIAGTTKGIYTMKMNKTLTADGWSTEVPQFFALPFSSSGQNISLTLKLNDKEENVTLPKINVDAGMKYVFRLAQTPQGITFFPELTEIISLNKETESSDLGNYSLLRLVYNGTQATAPLLTGTGKVTGSINWGDMTNESYASTLIHSFSKAGEYAVTIESWGSEVATIQNLNEVSEIDFSAF